jgi:acetylglutamate kinase
MAEKIYIIKIGGNILDEVAKLSSFLSHFAGIKEKKILVHGGGKLATQLGEQLGIPQQLVEGRRITDSATLKIVTMVYAGYINKNLVAQLQAAGCDAIGLCGADGNIIQAHKRLHSTIDYGFAGDIDRIDTEKLKHLIDMNLTPVIAPITHNGKGQLLNTNADTIAQETGKAMSESYDVILVYSFEKRGVLKDIHDEDSVIAEIRQADYEELKTGKKIFAGMIPKIDNAFAALKGGVKQVIIGQAEQLPQLLNNEAGTKITNEKP